MKEKQTYTLTQFNRAIENKIDDFFSQNVVWVSAELRKMNQKGGHRYLELSDSDQGKETARISAVLWASTYRLVEERTRSDLSEILRVGNRVLFALQVTFHRLYGLKAEVKNIDPAYTFGDIEKQKKETIEKLKKEGLLDLQKQLYLPNINKRIGIVGSPGTSGYRDFKNQLLNNPTFTNFVVKTFPSSVQGEKAKHEIIAALREAGRHDVDVVVLLRGGGSKMDLHIFNDYDICKTIAELKHPVLTGVGHQTDEVVADRVANRHHITPSALGHFIVERIGIFYAEVRDAYGRILQHALQILGGSGKEFQNLVRYFIVATQNLLREEKTNLSDLLHRLQLVANHSIGRERQELELLLRTIRHLALQKTNDLLHQTELLAGDVKFAAQRIVQQEKQEMYRETDKLNYLTAGLLDRERTHFNNLREKLNLLNPLTLLSKGYTISYVDGKDVDKAEGNLMESEMTTLSHQHIITSTIKQVTNRNDDE